MVYETYALNVLYENYDMAAVNDIVDTRVCKAPKAYNGDKVKWKHFKVSLGGYVAAVSPDLKAMMEVCELIDQPIAPVKMGLTGYQIALSGKLWTILTGCLEDTAMDVLCNSGEGNGLEVYRKLARKHLLRTAGHDRGRLVKLLTPDPELMKNDYWTRIDKWEERVAEYERLAGEGEAVGDKMKAGVLATVLAPKELHRHLAMNAHRLQLYGDIKNEI